MSMYPNANNLIEAAHGVRAALEPRSLIAATAITSAMIATAIRP
jgi:hypothetical protein